MSNSSSETETATLTSMALETTSHTTSEQDLRPDTMLLIQCAAKSIAKSMLTQLQQAADISHQYTRNPAVMRGRSSTDILDRVIRDMFGHSLTHRLGLQRKIIVDIETSFDADHALATAFKRKNWDLVPVRLLQRLDRPVSREASMDFARAFCAAVEATLVESIAAVEDLRVRQLFVREQVKHRGEHGMDSSAPCCVLKLLQEDYEMPYDKGKLDNDGFSPDVVEDLQPHTQAYTDWVFKHKLVEFSIKCGVCDGHHEFKVVR